MMLATAEHRLGARQQSMRGDQIVSEHRDSASPDSFERFYFEFDMQVGLGGKTLGQFNQLRTKSMLVQESISPKKHVEFQIIVRLVPGLSPEHAPFPASVTPAECQRLEFPRSNG